MSFHISAKEALPIVKVAQISFGVIMVCFQGMCFFCSGCINMLQALRISVSPVPTTQVTGPQKASYKLNEVLLAK